MEPTVGKFEVDKFDGNGDFALWKYRILGQFEILGLLDVIEEEGQEEVESVKPAAVVKDSDGKEVKAERSKGKEKDTTWKLRDKRARSLLGQCLSNTVLRKVMHEPTTHRQWMALKRDYQTKTKANRVYLKRQFTLFRMEEDKSIEENLDKFLKLINDLASLNVTIQDEDQAIAFLNSLPPQYDPLVHTLQFGNAKETITTEDVIIGAYGMESNLKQKGLLYRKKSSAESLVVERGRSEKRPDKKGKNGRSKSKGKSRSKSRSKPKSNNKGCWTCGSESHWKKECP